MKYGAKACNGFPSKLESAVHDMLLLRVKAGEFISIRRQHVVVLQPGDKDTRINWKIDFSCETPSHKTIFVEAKGLATADYKLKLKMFKAQKIGVIEIWSGDYRRPKLMERFEP